MHKRLREACLMFAVLSIAACAGAARREHPIYWYDTATPAGFPEAVRSVTEDRVSFEKETERFLTRLRRATGKGPINVLALSGGGAGAAFGAGALTGLSKAGIRPHFHVVTGVSAGALTAPFAFLGPEWDGELTESFSGQQSVKLVQFSLTGLLFGSSTFKGKPLADLVNHYATEEMLRAVAVEAAKGRLLLIATTDLDSERTVIWDMGAIAMHGGPAGLKLFRQVLIASASIPGLFPPVMIPVETSGTILEEMHVDGSTTASMFIAPEIASVLPDQLRDLRGANIYVIANGQYGAATITMRLRTTAIAKRGIQASLHSSTRGAVLATLALAMRNDMHFNVTAIPDDYPYNGLLDLKPERMRALFTFGADCAMRGELWTTPEGLLQRSFRASLTLPGSIPACPGP
ncbi:MAG TPA: patatin-like phospholipase family protein [Steroidobacteraceae bacterium]|nr:patatin-like phospholipase family protein [Steroidobacteraceae bacterium]